MPVKNKRQSRGLPFEIRIPPDCPISMDVVLRSISLMQTAAIATSHAMVEAGLGQRRALPLADRRLLHAAIQAQRDDTLWLDSVEHGSKKFTGTIRNVVFGGVAGITVLVGQQFVKDTLEKSDAFQEASEATANAIDSAADSLAKSVHEAFHAAGGALANGFEVSITVKDGRIVMDVHPLDNKLDPSGGGAGKRQREPGRRPPRR